MMIDEWLTCPSRLSTQSVASSTPPLFLGWEERIFSEYWKSDEATMERFINFGLIRD
jgi:hypothetical protein